MPLTYRLHVFITAILLIWKNKGKHLKYFRQISSFSTLVKLFHEFSILVGTIFGVVKNDDIQEVGYKNIDKQ